MEDHLGAGQVARDVDEHGAGAAGGGDVEGLAERAGEVVGGLQQEAVLDHGHSDAHDVGLLEAVRADDAARDLAGDDHHGDGVHVGRGDAGHRVGGSGAGGHEDHAHLAGGAGVAVGHVRGALLVAGQHVVDLLAVVEGVVDLDGLTAGVAKDGVHALRLEGGDDGLGARHGLALVRGVASRAKRLALDGQLAHGHLLLERRHERYAPLSALVTSFA